VREAQVVESRSYGDALGLWEDTLAIVERIISEYPSSLVAAKLVRGEAKVGGYTLAELEETAIPDARLKAQAEGDPLLCALVAAGAIREVRDRARPLMSIVDLCAKKGQTERATKILAEAYRTLKFLPLPPLLLGDEAQFATLLEAQFTEHTIASMYAELGMCDEAVLTYKASTAVSYGPEDPFVSAVRCYAETGQEDRAYEILAKALDDFKTKAEGSDSVRLWGLCLIGFGYAAVERRDKVAEVVSLAQEYAQTKLRGALSVSDSSLRLIADLCTRIGKYQEALALADTIESASWKSTTLAGIARSYAKAGEEEKAHEVLARALEISNSCKDADSRASALVRIATAYAEAGKKEEARKILLQAFEHVLNSKSDDERKADILKNVADGYAQIGQHDEAILVLASIPSSQKGSQPLADMARNYAEDERYEEALQIASTIGEFDEKAATLSDIACKLGEARMEIDARSRNILHDVIRELEEAGDGEARLRRIELPFLWLDSQKRQAEQEEELSGDSVD
jgi:tetratricopeptide (TPR) repeat protein